MITNAFCLEKLTPPEKIGGAEVCVERISRHLLENGHSVVVITQSPFGGLRSLYPKLELKEGVKIYSFYPLNIFSIYYTHKKSLISKAAWRMIDLINPLPAIFIRNILKRENPNIIHSHILHGFSPFFLFRFIKGTKIPLIQTLHSYGFICLKCDFFRQSGKICIKIPTVCKIFINISSFILDSIPKVLISPSKFCLNLYENNRFFPKSMKIVVPNGVELYTENPHKREFLKDGKLNILCAGRLVKIKGVDTLINAVKRMSSNNIKLHIIGEGFWEDNLKKLAGNDRRISFVGKVPWVKLKELYTICDITVLPSIYYEILGNVVLESMASGTPVIASRIGGIVELVQDGFNGYLFEPGDGDSLKKILEDILQNPSKLIVLGENAYNFTKRFNIKQHVVELAKIYENTTNIES